MNHTYFILGSIIKDIDISYDLFDQQGIILHNISQGGVYLATSLSFIIKMQQFVLGYSSKERSFIWPIIKYPNQTALTPTALLFSW